LSLFRTAESSARDITHKLKVVPEGKVARLACVIHFGRPSAWLPLDLSRASGGFRRERTDEPCCAWS